MIRAHDVEFKVHGEDLQFVEIMLDPGETVVAEAGAMMYMDSEIKMETIFDDGSGKSGSDFMGKLFSAGKRMITGESLFMTTFTNTGSGKRCVSFAAPYPGTVVPFDLEEYGGIMICQKDSFLCAAKGISVGIAFQKKIGVGLFGGEGFIMQKLEGDGLAFMHAGGTIIRKDLQQGETIMLDTGCLVAMTKTVNYDIQFAGNIKNALFGGEGLALASLSGPGSVWLQSLPFSRLADRIYAASKGGGKSKGEGSVLGNIGIGNLFGGND
jgi:TIGR00266 family protein